jgi:hypothetical protein
MKQPRYYIKNKLAKILVAYCIFIQSCYNNNNSVATESANDDTINYHKNKTTGQGALNNLPGHGDAAMAERKQMILMQIDSTYSAVAFLDTAKQELTDMAPAEITMAERNKRSKVIFNINIIQNELIRELDAAILVNLKTRTNELNNITLELKKDAGHLSTMVQQLNKITQCVSRLTNILAAGLSKGFIKPVTPKGIPAETIKAGVQ